MSLYEWPDATGPATLPIVTRIPVDARLTTHDGGVEFDSVKAGQGSHH